MLSAAELSLLGRLDLVHRRPHNGLYAGQRRSLKQARSPEFADFRPYVSGDDFRQIDWKAFARLDRLMLRLYVAEEEAALNVVVDASASMRLGALSKWKSVRTLAAALAFLGLVGMDRIAIGVLGREQANTRHLRGREGVGKVIAFLESIEPAGQTRPDDLRSLRWPRPGLTIIVSDFLVEGSWGPGLAWLRQRRQEPLLWQILAPEEERPTLSGDLKLIDAESGSEEELTVTSGLVAEYLAALAHHRAELRRAAEAAGGRFLHSLSSDDLEKAMAAGMRAGVVKRG